MNFRYKFSIVLIVLGLISVIMSFGGKNSTTIPPEEILTRLSSGVHLLPADGMAEILVNEAGIQSVDVRNPDRYKKASIPGAINIPLSEILESKYESLFENDSLKTVFYSDDELLSSQAWILCSQKGINNLYILGGGLAAWDSIVMNSEFEGETISAEQNALFEKRYKARRLYVQWNAMPDSLKAGFFAAKQVRDKELVGGCE